MEGCVFYELKSMVHQVVLYDNHIRTLVYCEDSVFSNDFCHVRVLLLLSCFPTSVLDQHSSKGMI